MNKNEHKWLTCLVSYFFFRWETMHNLTGQINSRVPSGFITFWSISFWHQWILTQQLFVNIEIIHTKDFMKPTLCLGIAVSSGDSHSPDKTLQAMCTARVSFVVKLFCMNTKILCINTDICILLHTEVPGCGYLCSTLKRNPRGACCINQLLCTKRNCTIFFHFNIIIPTLYLIPLLDRWDPRPALVKYFWTSSENSLGWSM